MVDFYSTNPLNHLNPFVKFGSLNRHNKVFMCMHRVSVKLRRLSKGSRPLKKSYQVPIVSTWGGSYGLPRHPTKCYLQKPTKPSVTAWRGR